MDRAKHRSDPTTTGISARSISWIIIMEKDYPPLPDGPVNCKACADSGRNIEMRRDTENDSYEATLPTTEDTDLQTFRCPECESVSVFRVSR